MLIGASALVAMLIGRPGDAATAAITTAVVMVVAEVSPQHAWQQPILRLADTVVGTPSPFWPSGRVPPSASPAPVAGADRAGLLSDRSAR